MAFILVSRGSAIPESAIHCLEATKLSLSRHVAEEPLATQVEVFEEGQAEDREHLDMPGGLDINSHEDMFNAVFGKVPRASSNRVLIMPCLVIEVG